MRKSNVASAFKPLAALALAAGATGCDGMNINFGSDFDGKPLSEIDLDGAAPKSVLLAGPDVVRIVEGSTFSISVAGSDAAKDRLLFDLDGDSFRVGRENGKWDDGGTATVTITMAAPSGLTMAGSGTIDSAALSGDAEINVLGSGAMRIDGITADTLDVTLAGAGTVTAAGTADTMELSIMGSGTGDMAGLTVGNADVSIMGSGAATFTSDGKIDADIMGSGSVVIRGNPTCDVSSMGSGTVRCEGGGGAGRTPDDVAAETPQPS